MIKAPACPRRVSKDESKRNETQTVESIREGLCLWPSSAATNTQWSANLGAARHYSDAYDFLKDQRGNLVSWKDRDNAELRKAVRHLERVFSSLARAQVNWISVAISSMVSSICNLPYVMTSNNYATVPYGQQRSRHKKRLAGAEAVQQETNDEKVTQVRQARRNTRYIELHHEQDDDTQARTACRDAQFTACNDEQNNDSDRETTQPRRTGKRNRSRTAKAQLLQAVENDRD
ncbi:hypothetical protein BCR37DRAFT_377941 [Protomyces lactucae-debilis]|uniref:Uncharacterized protein n=1 Tax=Protomyces lactucae-debilis TaxID=2754530 RepID=A0A1Y2FM27_PROLT|nr:uncharacterized protein BCR37DRAFT_377941 [Protomyces lactucae-debilis]ORY84979.1 hypothetical protein BCR37DRAFT_377941 [Protomyces lactucae-debilis]